VGSDLLTAEYESQWPVKESTLAAPRTLSESALYVGLLFGGTHLLRGARLTRRSDAQSLKRGRGLGLLLQGGFYLALALMSYVLGQQAESED